MTKLQELFDLAKRCTTHDIQLTIAPHPKHRLLVQAFVECLPREKSGNKPWVESFVLDDTKPDFYQAFDEQLGNAIANMQSTVTMDFHKDLDSVPPTGGRPHSAAVDFLEQRSKGGLLG